MKIKASGRSALIFAAGILACLCGPLQVSETAARPDGDVARAAAAKENNAATNAALKKIAKNRARPLKKTATVRSRKPAATEPKAMAETRPARAEAIEASDDRSALPPSIANANAELATADIVADDGLLARAGKVRLAATQDSAKSPSATTADIVAPDELNVLDMAAIDDKPQPIAATLTDVAASGADDSLSKTSLIGKIFIAFGGLLMLASAARMFMA